MHSQILMVSGFAVAALAMIVARRYGYAIFYTLATAEAHAQLRYPFHAWMRDYMLGYDHLENVKVHFQLMLLIGGGAALALAFLALAPFLVRMSAGRQLMALGAFGVLAMFGVELVSLHPIDAMMYHPIGSFALCPILYATSAGVAAIGALIEALRRQRRGATAA